MNSPLDEKYGWNIQEEVTSTQDVAAQILQEDLPFGVVFARNQVSGRGRHGRTWLSDPGDSLTMSLIFRAYPNSPAPHLVGMAVALAAASAIRCQLQWPNDLVIRGKKVGGILTELKRDSHNQTIPIVGLGVNLNQASFDDSISARSTSLALAYGGTYDAQTVAQEILQTLQSLPEPTSWLALKDIWSLFDQTAGKHYKINPEEVGIAIGIGSNGELLCTVEGETRTVVAADAIFG